MYSIKVFLFPLIFLSLFLHKRIFAVPTSFLKSESGNMNDLNWYRFENHLFSVYYEENSKNMGKYALISAQKAYPFLSLLLGVRFKNDLMPKLLSQENRFIVSSYEKIPIILGNRLEGAGFANPVTMSIEAQMIHARSAAFFQHELVHRLMYEHNNFHIGPAGRIFSLAMFPTWWLEGLAEYLTESVGSAETDGIARSMALNNSWPSWDRMHSLYNADGDTNLKGYVASGRFLGWILKQTKEKDLYKIHEEISKETIIPPFYNASDAWLYNNLGKNGETLYEEFKLEQKKEWENYIQGMPSIWTGTPEPIKEDFEYPTYITNDMVIFSKMTSSSSPKSSAFQVKDFEKNSEKRLPLSYSGSPFLSVSKETDGILLTTQHIYFANGSYGDELVVIKFKDHISQLSDKKVESYSKIEFATSNTPYVVDEIKNSGEGRFFISASFNGNQSIYFYNQNNNSLKLLKTYVFPENIKFIQGSLDSKLSSHCIYFILNRDLNKTSIRNICENGESKEVLEDKKLYIKDAYLLKDRSFRMLVLWDKVLSLVDISPLNKLKIVAVFPEWIQGITSWSPINENIMGAWIYKDGKYHFTKIDLEKLRSYFNSWQKNQNKNFVFAEWPHFNDYQPPYFKIYNEQKNSLLGSDKSEFEKHLIENEMELVDKNEDSSGENIPYYNEKASYRNNFLFAYPFGQPDFLGGPSLGLFAVPFIDEMERYRLQIFGGYNFYLNAPSGALTYLNNRILDSFSLSIFSNPLFNGYYDVLNKDKSITRYYNYLQQNGVAFFTGYKFRPSSFSLQGSFTISDLQPYNALITAPQSVGAQSTTLLGVTSSLSFRIFREGFYLENKSKPNGEWLIWSTNLSLGLGKFNSIGGSQNSVGQNTGEIDYYNANASFNSNFSFFKQNITLLGNISTTQGNNTFNLKEVYSPYQNYIIGENTSLNFVSYPIVGSGTLFDLRAGYWSYSGSINYDFPINSSFEKKFLMSFLDNWRGFISLKEGGVSSRKDFSTYDSVTSMGLGSGLTVDIKGFQIYPSLIYGFVFGDSGWYILTQVKFMDIL